MATSILEAFVVTFALQSKGFKDGAKEVDDTTKRVKDTTTKAFSGIEAAGKKTALGVRSLSAELIGLFLTFQGASSITSFVTGMVSSTASAERFGNTVGMTTAKIYAWRQAMKEMGGQPGEADSSLSAIERLKQAWITGQLGGDQAQLLQSLGINQQDLQNSTTGDILKKLSGAPRPLGDERYASQLQQLGLSQSMIYFLMQGQGKVEASIKAYEANTKEIEKQAKEAEELQKKMAALNDSVTKLLVPVLNRLLPPLTTIADWLAKWLGGRESKPKPTSGGAVWSDPLGLFELRRGGGGAPSGMDPLSGGGKGVPSWLNNGLGKRGVPAANRDPMIAYLMNHGLDAQHAVGVRAGIFAEGGTATAVNPKSGAFGIGQWLGARKRELFRRYGRNPSLQNQLEFLMWELRGGDHGGQSVLKATGMSNIVQAYIKRFMRPAAGAETIGDLRRASQYLRGQSSSTVTNIGSITINTRATDAQGIARELPSALRQRGVVVHADQRVRP